MLTDLVSFDCDGKAMGFSRYVKVEIITASSSKELEKKINKSKNNLIIVRGGILNRAILEKKKVDILTSTENIDKQDSLHYRNSGLNHVLCKIAYKNNIAIAFNFNDLLKAKGIERSILIGRMSQNVRLCRKYKLITVLASFATAKLELKNTYDLKSFGILLGMTPKEAKESLSNINTILEEKKYNLSNGLKLLKEKGL
ncbi:hypothetical protein J4231_01180 [Candidatus Woesearchaeota archaeon]|nr:hypothetical protein [Candidatus Woesearchaeota archaeon]